MTINQQNDLEMHYARYGLRLHSRDVIDCVDEQISPNDRLNLLVSNDNLGGDYYPGQLKHLHIIYTFNGLFYDEELDEGEFLTIPKQFSSLEEITLQDSIGFGLAILLRSVAFGLGVIALGWGISRVVRAWRFDK